MGGQEGGAEGLERGSANRVHLCVCVSALLVEPSRGVCTRVTWTSHVVLHISANVGSRHAWLHATWQAWVWCGQGCLSAVGGGMCRPVLAWLVCTAWCWQMGAIPESLYPLVHPDSAANGHSRFHLFPSPNSPCSSRSPRLCVAHLLFFHLFSPIVYRPPAH